jgi:hypothetical protein
MNGLILPEQRQYPAQRCQNAMIILLGEDASAFLVQKSTKWQYLESPPIRVMIICRIVDRLALLCMSHHRQKLPARSSIHTTPICESEGYLEVLGELYLTVCHRLFNPSLY